MLNVMKIVLTLLSLALAAAGRLQWVFLFDSIFYTGLSHPLPADGKCYNLQNLEPGLAARVKSIQVPEDHVCYLYSTPDCASEIRELYAPGYNWMYRTAGDPVISVRAYRIAYSEAPEDEEPENEESEDEECEDDQVEVRS
ncbi:hypothetical protein VTO42DRAFT_6665 [Malbranchea cinnamomea]